MSTSSSPLRFGFQSFPKGPAARLRRKVRDESGQVFAILAITLTALLGAAALTIDVGFGFYNQRTLQASADAAALAGAGGLPNTATAQSLANTYSGSANGKNAHANVPNVQTSVTTECVPAGPGCVTPNTVVVAEKVHVNSFFARVLGVNSFDVSARAAACSRGLGLVYLIDDSSGSCPAAGGPCTIGYPYSSSNPLTNIAFSESEVLRAFAPQIAGPNDTIKAWYDDEHALTLGVRQVNIITKSGGGKGTTTTTTNYPVTALGSDPGSTVNPAVGSTISSGDQAGTDVSARPMFPALFVTDITNSSNSTSGDWQFGGIPVPPNAVFGTWKAAVTTIDKTAKSPTVTVTPDPDPAKNNWNLGAGGDTPPGGLTNQGYGAEATWKVSSLGLKSGHAYRMQFMMHDGDQNKTGGDAGESCMTVVIP